MQELRSRKNPLIAHLKKLGADGDYRRTRGEFLCDGAKLLREAKQSGAEIKVVLTSGDTLESLPEKVAVYAVGQDIIDFVSPQKKPAERAVLLCDSRCARSRLAVDAGRRLTARRHG